MQQLVIERSKWYRGKGSEHSMLVKGGGKMCCLGFLGASCGLTKKSMLHRQSPCAVDNKDLNEDIKAGSFGSLISFFGNSDICKQLMRANDAEKITERQREITLRKDLKLIGVKVRFVD